MYADDFLKLNTLGEKSFKQATIIESKPVGTEPSGKKTTGTILDEAAISDGAMFLISFTLMLVWAIVAFRLSKATFRFSNVALRPLEFWEVTGDEMATIEHFHQLPCRNCRYFSNNPYLKCAIQPSIALTLQALNCSDYCPQNEDC